MGYCLVPFGSFQESYWHYTMGDNLACHVCRDLQFEHSEALHWLLFLFFPVCLHILYFLVQIYLYALNSSENHILHRSGFWPRVWNLSYHT